MVILDGTCVGCNNDTNTRFEQIAMRADFNVARILFELTRKKRTRANRKELSLPPVASGNAVTQEALFDIELDVEEYPNVLSLTMFEPAGKIVGIQRSGDLHTSRTVLFYIGPKPKQASNVTTREERNHTALALTIAKIAYCYAAAELGIEAFDGAEIRQLLRGERNDTYNFVGGLSAQQHLTERHLHKLYVRSHGNLLTVIVHLFASCKMGAYEVVVGRLNT